MDNNVVVNDAKNEIIEVGGKSYKRLAVKTRVIMDGDDLCEVVATYAKPNLLENDILFITEKIVACTQGRAIPMKDIHPGRLAIALSHFVTKTPAGIGLGIPETMEMALHECGTLRILFAAFIAIIGKLFCQKGWFYIVAGNKASSIDGPCEYTLPPYNEYVVLGPEDPSKVAKKVSESLGGIKVIITDINDLGGKVLGASHKEIDFDKTAQILKDNPLGQESEQTPMGIIREI